MIRNYLLAFCLGALLLFACEKKQKKNTQDIRTTFRYNELSSITSLDPAAASRFENITAVNQLFNGLVKMDDSLRIVGDIAKRWTISEDGREYTFILRDDVFFHNDTIFNGGKGRKVVADDFVHSFFRLYDASISNATTLLTNIDRGERSNNKGFIAINDTTFKIFLKAPFTPFLGVLTMKFFSVVPHEVVEHYGADFRSHPIGTGPFKFKLWEEGVKLILVKNENYFEKKNNEQLPYLDAVSISFIKDKETAFMEFMKGNIDMLSGIDAINKDEVFTKNGELNDVYKANFYVQSQPYLKTDYLGFLIDSKNKLVEYSPIKIKAVRQAINYAIDRKKMVKYLHAGFGTPATAGFIPPGLNAFDATKVVGYTYDPDKARQLLTSAGFPNGNGLPEITLYSTEQYADICEFVQAQLKEIGIRVNINIEKAAILYEAVASSQVLFFRKSWLADYPDAETFLSVFYSKNFSPQGYNYTHYKNAKYDALYEQAQIELNEKNRNELYQQMDRMIVEEAPIVPLYYDHVVRLVNKNISGLSSNAMNILDLRNVKKTNK
ncbi:MAG: ABC transporter substrate-binding protein [Bacteroidetes bacterium]|nr:ABC transporter substrate-binding protein [Bacteroidota bacterium]